MPIAMEQDFPRGGGGGWTTRINEAGGRHGESKKKRRSKKTIIDSIEAEHSKDDLIAGDEGGREDGSDDELLDTARESLFKVPKKANPTKKLRDRARAAAEATAKEKEGEEEGEFVVEPLTYDAIQVGLLSLGVVHEIREHEVIVSLPGRTVGAIPLTAVSTPYANLLAKVESGAEEIRALKPLSFLFTLNQLIIVRVTHINEALTATNSIRRKIILSSNPADLHSNYNATVIEEGMQLTAAVQSVEDHGLVLDVGVKGVRSFLPKNRLTAKAYNEAAVGQLLQCKVVLAKVQRLLCNVTFQALPSGGRVSQNIVENLNAALLLPGMTVDCHVMQTHKTGMKVYFMELMGSVHQDHTGKPWELPFDHERYTRVEATVLYIQPSVGSLPALSLRRDLCPGRVKVGASLQRGVSYTVTVERFEKRGLIVKFDGGAKGIVSTRRCFPPEDRRKGKDTNMTNISAAFPPGSKHRCRILEYSELDELYVGSFAHADAPTEGEGQLRAGAVVKCEVVEWKKGGALVRVRAGPGSQSCMAFITNLHFDKYEETKTRKRHHPEGSILKARVLRSETGKILLTARKKLLQSQEDPVEKVADCHVGMKMNGLVFRAGPKGLHVAVLGGVVGFVPASQLGVPSCYIERRYPAGEILRVRVVEVEPERPTLIFQLEEEGVESSLPLEEMKSEPPETTEESQPKAKAKKRRQKPEKDNVEVKKELDLPPTTLKRPVKELRPPTSFWDVEEAFEKQEKAEESQPPPKKKSKRQRALEREESIRFQESALADPTRPPSSANEYELLLVASPSSSMAWIKYMSMQLEAGNLEEARAIGERALSTIPCTEERERFNVWTAVLNLENEHGTAESLKTKFTAALRNCDELATYKQMAQIYMTTKKNEEARSLLRLMTKKFPSHVQVWSMAAQHLYRTHQFDEARSLYTRAVAALPPRAHVEIISKFAQLELTFGDFEQGRSLYEKLVCTYSARVDIWLVYINQLIKQKDSSGARALFERVVASGAVNPRKMQPVFKRWLEFEREEGTLESVCAVEETCAGYYKERLGLSVLDGGEQLD